MSRILTKIVLFYVFLISSIARWINDITLFFFSFFFVDEDIALLIETKGVSNSDLGVGGLSSFVVQ